jgi:hypothetical protein
MAEPRSAQSVINQAIKENRAGEQLLYVFASILVGVGAVTILSGVVAIFMGHSGGGIASLAGAIASSLFYPAIRQTREIREANIAIRMMEIPLSRASSAEEAARTIQEAFLGRLVGSSGGDEKS